MTAGHALSSERHPFHDRLVLAGRPLRPGSEPARPARFGDDIWDLSPASFQRQHVAIALDFSTVPPQHRVVAKELFIALLTGPPPAREPESPKVTTIASLFATTRQFLTWLDNRSDQQNPPRPMSALTRVDALAYQQHLLATQSTIAVRDNLRVAVRYFWRYRNMLITDRLTFDPHQLDGWGERGVRNGNENSTERIPEQVLGPLLTWSLRFVDHFAADILAADREWRRIRLGEGGKPREGRRWVRAALEELLDEHRRTNRPIPGHNGRPNQRHLARLLGCDRTSIAEYRHLIDETATLVGVRNIIAFDVAIGGLIEGNPWISEITTQRGDRTAGVLHLLTMLTAACYIVIAFLSGMRDSEIKHLRRGCLTVKRDAYDKPYRWMITSLAFKGENDPTGVEATWVVGAPVARAIAVLEQIQPVTVTRLFAPSAHGTAVGIGEIAEHVTLTSTTNNHLNDLVGWINDYCRAHARIDGIPNVNTRPWRLTTRQFRRTLAWFIARQPGGSIAGAIQYRHQSIQMFEGYAGTSDSGFRAEVESEQALARGEHLMAMTDANQHEHLGGPAREEARRRLAEFDARMRFQGMVITDRHRQTRLMRRHDPAIYPGRYATCVFDPDKALCTRTRTVRGQVGPTIGNCQPLECRNVALTADNIAELRQEVTEIDGELTERPYLPPLLLQRLHQRRDQIMHFADQHDSAQS